jgi:hypothetical protein
VKPVQLEILDNKETLVQQDQLDQEETLDKEETLVLLAIQELLDRQAHLGNKGRRDRLGLLVPLETLEELGQPEYLALLVLLEETRSRLQEGMMDQQDRWVLPVCQEQKDFQEPLGNQDQLDQLVSQVILVQKVILEFKDRKAALVNLDHLVLLE